MGCCATERRNGRKRNLTNAKKLKFEKRRKRKKERRKLQSTSKRASQFSNKRIGNWPRLFPGHPVCATRREEKNGGGKMRLEDPLAEHLRVIAACLRLRDSTKEKERERSRFRGKRPPRSNRDHPLNSFFPFLLLSSSEIRLSSWRFYYQPVLGNR